MNSNAITPEDRQTAPSTQRSLPMTTTEHTVTYALLPHVHSDGTTVERSIVPVSSLPATHRPNKTDVTYAVVTDDGRVSTYLTTGEAYRLIIHDHMHRADAWAR